MERRTYDRRTRTFSIDIEDQLRGGHFISGYPNAGLRRDGVIVRGAPSTCGLPPLFATLPQIGGWNWFFFVFDLKLRELREGFSMTEDEARITLPLELTVQYTIELPPATDRPREGFSIANCKTEKVDIYSSGDLIYSL